MSTSILSNTIVASAGRVINTLAGVWVIGLLTRLLGDAQFGYYTLVLTYGSLLQLAADAGLYLTLTRLLAQEPAARREHLAHVLVLRVGLLVGAGLGGVVLALVFPPLRSLTGVFLLIWGGLVAQSISQLLMGVYQTDRVVWRVTVGDLAGRLLQVGALLALGAGATLVDAALIFTISTGAALVMHLLLLPQRLAWPATWQTPLFRRLWQLSWPLGMMLVLNAVYFRIDMLILSYWRTPAEVGHYGLAYRIIESSLFFPAMFGGLLLPRLSERVAGAASSMRVLLEQSARLLLSGALLATGVLAVLAQPLVRLIGGAEFGAAAPYLAILSLALGVMFMGNLFGFALVALGRSRVLLWLYAALACANTLANLAFIPRGGATAAAWTTVATEVVAMSVAAYVVWRTVRFRLPWPALFAMVVSIAVTLGMLHLLPPSIPVVGQLAAATALYGALLVLSGTLTRRHLDLLLAPR